MFIANVGCKIGGRYWEDAELARLPFLPADRVLLDPKGTPADVFLLPSTRNLQARVVTTDRLRVCATDCSEVALPGFLIRGGFRTAGF